VIVLPAVAWDSATACVCNEIGKNMRIGKTLIATVAATAIASTSFAGGLSPEIMEAPVAMEDEMAAPAASSINPLYILGGVAAAFLILKALEEDEEEDRRDEPDDCEPFCDQDAR
jgi:hypothetical protein